MTKLIVKNKKALHDYELVEKYVAGISLKGYEVKAIKEKKVSFEGAYIQVLNEAPYVVNMYIGRYSKQSSSFSEFDARRSRKLLLLKKEIEKIQQDISQKRKTAVPLALVMEGNKIKLEFAIVRGRKEFEKKQVAKERQIQKDLERESKEIRKELDV